MHASQKEGKISLVNYWCPSIATETCQCRPGGTTGTRLQKGVPLLLWVIFLKFIVCQQLSYTWPLWLCLFRLSWQRDLSCAFHDEVSLKDDPFSICLKVWSPKKRTVVRPSLKWKAACAILKREEIEVRSLVWHPNTFPYGALHTPWDDRQIEHELQCLQIRLPPSLYPSWAPCSISSSPLSPTHSDLSLFIWNDTPLYHTLGNVVL